MHPLSGLQLPSATGGADMPVRVVLAIAAMRLDDHDGAALESAATDPAEAIIHTPGPTSHARPQHRLGLRLKRLP